MLSLTKQYLHEIQMADLNEEIGHDVFGSPYLTILVTFSHHHHQVLLMHSSIIAHDQPIFSQSVYF
jgi:hypothetical protein